MLGPAPGGKMTSSLPKTFKRIDYKTPCLRERLESQKGEYVQS